MKTKNKLHHIEEFRKVLKGYRPSDESLQILHETPIVLLVGPTAAGRNKLINLLVATHRYHYIVSHTTRLPRKNDGVMEEDGVEYWFKSEEYFLDGLRAGAYLEAAIIHDQQVSGISLDELTKARLEDKIAVDEIEVNGAEHIQRYKNDALFIFLLPPTFEIWMERLGGRGQMDEAEVRRRLESAVEEITTALGTDFYHFVINNEIHEAATAVDELAKGREPDAQKQQLGRDHAEQLIINTELYLNKPKQHFPELL
ncbi:MAG: hypothetical protein M3Q14_04520 [bacterium]|nr:hypothetical protein [bacterium]